MPSMQVSGSMIPVPQWDIDSVISHNVIEEIEMGGRFTAQKLQIEASEVALSGEG